MKTAKEKAKELFEKFSKVDGYDFNIIQCALIAVDEIIEYNKHKDDLFIKSLEVIRENYIIKFNPTTYWQEVKKEIELL